MPHSFAWLEGESLLRESKRSPVPQVTPEGSGEQFSCADIQEQEAPLASALRGLGTEMGKRMPGALQDPLLQG